MTVVVFGSINMDLVVRVERFPLSGETLLGSDFFVAPGGKGANQAVAAARMGAPTKMIGHVGDDMFGRTLRRALQADGVDDQGVLGQSNQTSGIAVITVDDQADNRIIAVSGANAIQGGPVLAALEQALQTASVLLLQLEIPLPMVLQAAQLAQRHGVKVVLDPAPAQPLPAELYALIDIITPNEIEAATLMHDTQATALDLAQAGQRLIERGVKLAVITCADQGIYWTDGREQQFMPAFAVQAIDTIAAGDAFNGALAAALSSAKPLRTALEWGLAAGALAVTKAGAQPALPHAQEVHQLLAHGTRRSVPAKYAQLASLV